jgi:hypothetical protein
MFMTMMRHYLQIEQFFSCFLLNFSSIKLSFVFKNMIFILIRQYMVSFKCIDYYDFFFSLFLNNYHRKKKDYNKQDIYIVANK